MTLTASGRRRGWLAAALAGAAAVCFGGGAHLLSEPARAAVAQVGTVPEAGGASTSAAGPDAVGVRAPTVRPEPGRQRPMEGRPQLPALALPPVAFRDPALRLRAPVVPVGTGAAGSLELPDNPGTLGWWAGSALPGASSGTVVLAGHLDTLRDGPGVMAAVVQQRVGAQVQLVDTAGSTTTYRVAAVRSYPKAALPAAVFAGAGRARLVLVTCGGTFDEKRHHYSDNVVVYAVPVTR